LDEFKSARLINELSQTEINVMHMVKHASTNNVNNISGENYAERESGTDKNS
jgi:hypothetical protein